MTRPDGAGVRDEWVEMAVRVAFDYDGAEWESLTPVAQSNSLADMRNALAAVIPLIRAQALEPVRDLRLSIAGSPFDSLTKDSMVRSLDAALHLADSERS